MPHNHQKPSCTDGQCKSVSSLIVLCLKRIPLYIRRDFSFFSILKDLGLRVFTWFSRLKLYLPSTSIFFIYGQETVYCGHLASSTERSKKEYRLSEKRAYPLPDQKEVYHSQKWYGTIGRTWTQRYPLAYTIARTHEHACHPWLCWGKDCKLLTYAWSRPAAMSGYHQRPLCP